MLSILSQRFPGSGHTGLGPRGEKIGAELRAQETQPERQEEAQVSWGPGKEEGASVGHMKVINGLDRGGGNKVRDGGVLGADSSTKKFASEMLMEGRAGVLGRLPRSRA